MPLENDVSKLITEHERRLQKLKEKKARFGINTPPEVLIEIEDIEEQIKLLETELEISPSKSLKRITTQLSEVVAALNDIPELWEEILNAAELMIEHIQSLQLSEEAQDDAIFTINRLRDESEGRQVGKRLLPVKLYAPSEHHFPDYANWLATLFDTRTLVQLDKTMLYRLISLQNRQHRSWLNGDYFLLEEVGRSFIRVGHDCDHKVARTQVQHLGWYLVGEAKRLQGTLTRRDNEKMRLFQQSKDAYEESLRLIQDNFRSVRGLGKAEQSLAIYTDSPGTSYQNAKALYQKTLEMVRVIPIEEGNWDLARHEELRAWRHRIDLAIQMLPTEGDPNDIAQQISDCRDLHLRILPQIAADPQWMYLEFFMAYTFLGGAMVTLVSRYNTGLLSSGREMLRDALKNRVLMIQHPIVDARLRENLEWWGSKLRILSSDEYMERAAEQLDIVLRQGHHPDNLVDDLKSVAKRLR